jgi:hypothetical protein
MTGKRIEFPKKPILKNTDQFIDAWVSGNHKQEKQNLKLKRTTIFLPEELHKKLKIEAAKREVTMTEIIIESIENSI